MGKHSVFIPFRIFKANLEGRKVTIFFLCLKSQVVLDLFPQRKRLYGKGPGALLSLFSSLCEPVNTPSL